MKTGKKSKAFSIMWGLATLASAACLFTACGQEPTLEEVQLMMMAQKDEYVVGETFDPTGLVLAGVYSDGSRKEIKDYTIDKTGPLTVDDTVVTITYEGRTFEQPITVITADKKVVVQLANGVDTCLLYANGNVALVGNVSGGITPELAHWTWDGKKLEIWITICDASNGFEDHQTLMNLEYDEQ
ncbi:MAG: bacterial Ig-like domain-containing protein [Clostridia bacterium]|nr:bacterial Ig-like domain-containing protein [Clostridia bacterium]